MSVIPGYDFDDTELVTPQNLLKWMIGAYVDPANPVDASAAGLTALAVGTGPTGVSLTGEGQFHYNYVTGKVEIETRNGPVPVFGGGMFTRRFKKWYNLAAGRQLGMYSIMTLAANGTSRVTVSDPALIGSAGWEAYTPCAWAQPAGGDGVGNYGGALSPAVLWPALGETGITEYTLGQGVYRLACIRGLTPMWGTYNSSFSGVRCHINANGFSNLIATNSELDQWPYYYDPIVRYPRVWNQALDDYPDRYMAWIQPCAAGISANNVFRATSRV